MLRKRVDDTVNDVNARHVARERGISVTTTAAGEHADYTNAIRVQVEGGLGSHVVGAVYDGDKERILRIDHHRLEMIPGGPALLVTNDDKPGIIGVVGSALGELGINVSRLAMSLHDEHNEALLVWSVDSSVPDSTLESLRRVDGILRVQRLTL